MHAHAHRGHTRPDACALRREHRRLAARHHPKPQERSTVPSNYLLDYLPGFRLRLEELATRLDDPLLHGLLHEPPHGGGAAMSQAVDDVAEYDGQAAIARLRGHVASALRYVRERERASSTSTGSTTGTVLADSP